ncbi:hypothetical protein OROHE_005300 [Orobanche hederae]
MMKTSRYAPDLLILFDVDDFREFESADCTVTGGVYHCSDTFFLLDSDPNLVVDQRVDGVSTELEATNGGGRFVIL